MPDIPINQPDSDSTPSQQNIPTPPSGEVITPSLTQSSEAVESPELPNSPQPSGEPDTQSNTLPPTPTAPENTPAHVSSPESHVVRDGKRGPHFLKPLIVLIIILAAVAVAAFYLDKHHNQQTTNTKKDIPYLTYGFSDSGDVTPSYPTESADTSDSIYIYSQVFEGLVAYTDQTKIEPLLATSWTNPNNSTWIFNLRHGVKFHSGRTMTATDVKYSLDYAVAHQNNAGGATNLAQASTIKQVDILNSYQVKITTTGPDAVLLNRLVDLYIIDSKAKLGDPDAGTGPYIVKPGTVKPNATTLDLVAYDSYWGGHVYTRAVHFQEFPTIDALAAATAKGQFDLSGDYNSQQTSIIKSKASYYQPITITDIGVNFISLNTLNKSSPLYSLAARQAVQSALNIPAILKAGALSGIPVNQIIPSSLPGYDPGVKTVPYDPAQAKKLLASVPNLSTPITLSFPAGDEGQVGEIAKELDAVGFHVKLNDVPDLSTLVNSLVNGQGDMFYLSYTSSTLDGLDMINNVVLGTQNYSSPTITALASQAGNTLDPTTRLAILQKIEEQVAKDVPTVALYSQTRTFALTKPYVVKVDLPSIDAGVYFWQVYQK